MTAEPGHYRPSTEADPAAMHRVTPEIEQVAEDVIAYVRDRLHGAPRPFAPPRTLAELAAAAGETVTEEGIGGEAALQIFAETLAPASVPIENPRFLAFIPAAPSHAAKLFDMALAATPMYAGSWRSAAGTVYAENQALRWLAELAGMPAEAGGCFVQGGTVGNLSALVAARHAFVAEHGRPPGRLRLAATDQAHSSVVAAAAVMDADVLAVAPDARGRLTGAALEEALRRDGGEGVFAVAATGGTTNLGVIDDLAGIADVCAGRGLWFHIDAAYGGAALAAPSVRPKFAGVERVRLDHHRPAQMALRAVRLLRAPVPPARAGTGGAPPARRLPRRRPRRRATGTRPTSASTSRAAPAGSRSGSRSRATGRVPTPMPSSSRWRWRARRRPTSSHGRTSSS